MKRLRLYIKYMRVSGLSLIWLVLLAGCNLNTDYFKDYQGVNLIRDYNFDAASTPWATEAPTGGPTYMAFASSAVTGPTVDGTIQPVYTLTVKNLISDGDMEASSFPLTQTGSNGTKTFSNTNLISGSKSLNVTSTSVSDTYDTINLNTYATVAGTYQIQFDYRSSDRFFAQFYEGASFSPFKSWQIGWTAAYDQSIGGSTTDNSFSHSASFLPFASAYLPLDFSNLGNAHVFVIGQDSTAGSDPNGFSATPWQVTLDNFSFIRTDIALTLAMTISTLNSTAARLIPGIYDFSVYVMDDPSAGADLNPRYVTLTLTATLGSGGTYTQSEQFARPAAGWTSWTLVTLEVRDLNVPDTLPSGATDAMELRISPTHSDVQYKASGSVLVAGPRLEFKER